MGVVDFHIGHIEVLMVPLGVGPAWPDGRDHSIVYSVRVVAVIGRDDSSVAFRMMHVVLVVVGFVSMIIVVIVVVAIILV